ncbi:MAG: hypothetical protein AAB784_02060 [Patescibacteria group bacterium]
MPDDQYYQALAYARNQQKELREVQDIFSQTVKPPSKSRYALLYGLAILGDVIDLTVFTGIGAVISFFIDIFIAIILFFAGKSASNRIKATNQFRDEMDGHIQRIEKKIIAYRNAYAKALRASRKIKILRKPIRKLALGFKSLRGSITKNPMIRTAAAAIADIVPILDLVPWRTWSIYLLKRDEMLAFQEAQNMLSEYMSVKTAELEATNELQEAEMNEQSI